MGSKTSRKLKTSSFLLQQMIVFHQKYKRFMIKNSNRKKRLLEKRLGNS